MSSSQAAPTTASKSTTNVYIATGLTEAGLYRQRFGQIVDAFMSAENSDKARSVVLDVQNPPADWSKYINRDCFTTCVFYRDASGGPPKWCPLRICPR